MGKNSFFNFKESISNLIERIQEKVIDYTQSTLDYTKKIWGYPRKVLQFLPMKISINFLADIFAGFTFRIFITAILLHLAFFWLLNFYLYSSIVDVYQNMMFDPQNDFSVWESNKNIIRWQTENLRVWLNRDVEGFSENDPMVASTLIYSMFATIKSPSKQMEQRQKQLQTMITGNITGMKIFWLRTNFYSAERIFQESSNIGGREWDKIFENDKNVEDKRSFIIYCIRLLQSKVNSQIRFMKRFSDSIQYIIFLISWILLCHLSSRYFEIIKMENMLASDILNNLAKKFKTKQELTLDQAKDLVENRIYYPYQFFLGTIPSLGFIGTVLGMGQALLKADNLFSAQNLQERQLAVSQITQELGFAFDTTFIALVASIFVGILFLACHRKENKILINCQ